MAGACPMISSLRIPRFFCWFAFLLGGSYGCVIRAVADGGIRWGLAGNFSSGVEGS